MTISLAVCVACGDLFGRRCWKDAMKFCDRDCFLLHVMDHGHKRRVTEKRREREREYNRRYKKRNYSAASKTIEEDLAWMYDGKSAFLEDSARKATRREGGAGSRRLR